MRKLRLTDLKAGNFVMCDNGFTCMVPGRRRVAESDKGLYVACMEGQHYLSGQVGDDGYLIGISATDQSAPDLYFAPICEEGAMRRELVHVIDDMHDWLTLTHDTPPPGEITLIEVETYYAGPTIYAARLPIPGDPERTDVAQWPTREAAEADIVARMAAAENEEWGWYYSFFEDDDNLNGPFKTRDDAISDGRKEGEFICDGTIYIIECRAWPPGTVLEEGDEPFAATRNYAALAIRALADKSAIANPEGLA